MKYLLHKDYKHRVAATSIARKRLLLKAVAFNTFLPNEMRNSAWRTLANFSKYGMSTKMRNRCILTNRARSVSSVFKLGRSKFHVMAGARLAARCKKIILVNLNICKKQL